MASSYNKPQLSQKGSGAKPSEPDSSPVRQKHRMAMGEKVDGQNNPFGSDAPSSKPTIKGGW